MLSLTIKDTLLEYAYRRIVELESLLLLDVPETVWPAEVTMVFMQVNAGVLPAHHQHCLHLWRLHNG